MAAITLINDTETPAEFNVASGSAPVVRVGVQANGQVIVPVKRATEENDSNVSTAQQWTVYAIVNGITTPNVTVTNPDATVTIIDDADEGYTLHVS